MDVSGSSSLKIPYLLRGNRDLQVSLLQAEQKGMLLQIENRGPLEWELSHRALLKGMGLAKQPKVM